MKNAYLKDILRTIKRNGKRFLALVAIAALGITVFVGFYAACRDMVLAADAFYDEQRLFDIRVLSTLGLTDDDVAALQRVGGVHTAEGGYVETVDLEVGGVRQTAQMTMVSEKGLNQPHLLEGALPRQAGEICVTSEYLAASGKAVGDSVTIEERLEQDEEQTDDESESAEPEPAPEPEPEPAAEEEDDDLATDVDWDADVEIEEEAEQPTFLHSTYTITGVVTDAMDIANNTGTTSFRSTASTDYTFFVSAADVDSDVYTVVYLLLEGLAGLECYSQEYEETVASVIALIEGQIMEQREQLRYEAVLAEAVGKITDAEATMDEKFAEADEQFADAWAEVEQAKRDIIDGEAELTREEQDALQKLADARAELEDGKAQLHAVEAELAAGEAKLAEGEAELLAAEEELIAGEEQLAEGRAQLEQGAQEAQAAYAETEALFAQKQAELDAGQGQLSAGADGLKAALGDAWPAAEWDALVAAAAAQTLAQASADPTASPDASAVGAATTAEQEALAAALAAVGGGEMAGDAVQTALGLGVAGGGQQALNAQKAAYEEQKAAAQQQLAATEQQLAEAEAELEAGRLQLEEGRAELEAGRAELEAGRAQLAAGWAELAGGEEELNREEADALRKLADAWQELADGKQELAEGEAELVENQQKYEDKKQEAERELADAWAELADIDMAQWYVQDRSSLDSYSSLDNDMRSIDSIGKVFPILFLVVAVLISLTTMTRMVEEERGLIGTYKALGFSGAAICGKYLLYALAASVLGGLLGNLLGFVALPKILIAILQVIYTLPQIPLHFSALYGAAGAALFIGSISLTTALACGGELRQTPAALMRPKAPRAGSRILLERVKPLWKRLGFLNKVTARNLFRYKRRLFMTVIGIAGCTALVLAGFAIRDTVTSMGPKQYEALYRYDLMLVGDGEEPGQVERLLADDPHIADYLPAQIENVKLLNSEGASETVQMIVIPDGAALSDYIYTPSTEGEPLAPGDGGVLITQNASVILKLAPGDTVALQNLRLDQYDTTVTGVVENYLGNSVYLTQSVYNALFGDFEPNGAYAHFTSAVTDPSRYAEGLLEEDFILSSLSTATMSREFTTNFAVLNAVIYILIVLAAGLAFVVLFTLSSTNISERVRELATIKVLGFFDKEVHAYVNKETLLLTGIGVVAGLPLGYLLSALLMVALKMPSIHFALEIRPLSYLISAVVSFSFALIVNLMTNRTLDRIDMVEALKSVE